MRPSLCSCQCIAVERESSFCMRYMPTFRVPVFGSWVMTAGSVMNGAGSPGQQCWIGRRSRSTSSPSSTTSWWAARRTVFGRESAIDFSVFRPRTFSARPCGGCISSTDPSFAAASSRRSTPSARHMRRSVPNWLIEQRMRRALRVLEEQRRPAGAHGTVDDLGHLEVRVDLGRRRGRARPRARGARSTRAGQPAAPSRSV